MALFHQRPGQDVLPASHFDDYASPSAFANEVANVLKDPASLYQKVSSKDLIEEYQRRNPLMKLNRRFVVPMQGSIASFAGGMKWTPDKDEIQNFLRSARSLPDYHMLKQACGVNKEVERGGSAEDAIILEMKNLGFSNNFPFGLMVKVTGIRGNQYARNQRGICYIPPGGFHQTPEAMAQVLHAIDPSIPVHEAFMLDSIDEKTLRDEILDIPGDPTIKVIKAGGNAHIARILAASANANALLQRVKFDAKTHVIESLSRVGELMTVDTDAVELCIEGFKKTKEDHQDFIPRTNFHEMTFEFLPVSSNKDIGWSNIGDHEVFRNMSKEDKERELNDPRRHAHLETFVEYLFKDELLRNKLFPAQ